MSITDPNADDVQAPEAQGDGGTADAPYAEYLARIPDEARGPAEEAFKAWDADWTRKSQEHADYRKQWERYEPTGVSQYDPEAVAWAMQFYDAQQNNPQAVVEWAQNYAQENGVPFGTPEPEQAPVDDFGFQDPQQLQTLIDQATGPLKQQLEQMQGHIEQQQQQQQQQQIHAKLEGQVAQIEQKNGAPLTEKQKEVLARFASNYTDADNAILRGWDDMQAYTNDVEKGAFQAKTTAPAPAEGGGVPDVSPERFKGLGDPGLADAAKQFLRNNRG